MSRQKKITIIVPCYNEATRLSVESFSTFINDNNYFHFIFVNDGSSDRTLELLEEINVLVPKQTSILSYTENRGKAEAVRRGVLKALKLPTDYVGFWDADLATPLTELHSFAAVFSANNEIQIVCGSRVKRLGSFINRFIYRHYGGRVIATVISILLKLPVYDTQCGAKIIHRELAENVFRTPFISRWLFDVELFARTIGKLGRQQTIQKAYEIPLKTWVDTRDSKISLLYLPRIPLELAKISIRYRAELKKP